MHVYFDVGFSGLCWTARLVLRVSDSTEYHVFDLKVASESGAVELSSHHPIKSFLRHPQILLVQVAVIVAANLNVPVYHHFLSSCSCCCFCFCYRCCCFLSSLLLLLLRRLLLCCCCCWWCSAASLFDAAVVLVWCNTTSTLSLLGKPERYDGLNDERVSSDDQTWKSTIAQEILGKSCPIAVSLQHLCFTGRPIPRQRRATLCCRIHAIAAVLRWQNALLPSRFWCQGPSWFECGSMYQWWLGLNLFWRIAECGIIIDKYIYIEREYNIYDCIRVCNYCHSALTWEAKLHSGKSVYCSCKGTIYRSRCSRAWLNQSQLVTVECKNVSKSLKPINTVFTWSTAPRQGTGQESIPQVWFERHVCVDLGKVVGILVFGTGGLMKSLARLYI